MIGPIHYHDEESSQSSSLGSPYRQDRTARTWKYAEAGGTALANGKVTVSPVIVANHDDMSFNTAPAVGDEKVLVTLGATAVSADQYRDGFVVIQDGTGEGHAHPLESHPAYDASADPATFYLAEGEQILEAGATAETNVNLIRHRQKDVIIPADTNQNDVPAGVPNIDVTADYFFMNQTWGPCSVWHDEAPANLGEPLTFGAGVAGQVEGVDAATELTIGHAGPGAGAAGDYQLVFLRIEP